MVEENPAIVDRYHQAKSRIWMKSLNEAVINISGQIHRDGLKQSHNYSSSMNYFFFCDPAGIRTQGPNIKSVVLYQLSYEINQVNRAQK